MKEKPLDKRLADIETALLDIALAVEYKRTKGLYQEIGRLLFEIKPIKNKKILISSEIDNKGNFNSLDGRYLIKKNKKHSK